jgi:hypothetical protein
MATLYVTVWEVATEVALGDPLQSFQVDIAATTTQSIETIVGSDRRKRRIRVFPSADCFVEWGENPTATSTASRPMGSENPEYFEIESGYKIAVIERLSDATGDVVIDHGNSISTTSFNSRAAATLAASATFQGVGEDVHKYGRVGVSIISDNATDGVLTMEVSRDNITWGGPTRAFSDTRFAEPHMWNIVEKYFRIKYVNGTTEATNLAIQVQYSNNADIFLGHQLDQIINLEAEAILIRPTTEYDLDCSRENLRGQGSSSLFGYNDAITNAWQDIHSEGGDIPWQTTAQSVEVVSTDAADNGTTPGAGLHSVEVHGLSATGADQTEIILTDGTAAVAGALTYIRVNRMHSEKCGTYGGSHQGDVTLRIAAAGANLVTMKGDEGLVNTATFYGLGEAGNGYYTVPLGKVMYITRLQAIISSDVAANKVVSIILYEREDILDNTTPFSPKRVLWKETDIDKSIAKEFKHHLKVKPLTDIWFRAFASTSSRVEVTLDFYLVDENSNNR